MGTSKADDVVSLALEPSLMIFHRSPVQIFLRALGSALPKHDEVLRVEGRVH